MKNQQYTNQAFLSLILIISGCLRIILAFNGGQFWFPDEIRYFRSFDLWDILRQSGVRSALIYLSTTYDHGGFSVIGLLPVVIQKLSMIDARIAASVMAQFSTANIALIYGIAKNTGLSSKESLLACILMSTSSCMIVYSRHLVPYDSALFFALFAIWLGTIKKSHLFYAFICGLLANISFWIYSGYWIISGTSILICTFYIYAHNRQKTIFRFILLILGFCIPFLMLSLTSYFYNRSFYFDELLKFSRTAVQGDFSEGFKIPFIYLFYAEYHLSLVFTLGIFVFLFHIAINGKKTVENYLWALVIVMIYMVLFFQSTIMNSMVVYGRTVRQMIPFICLVSAQGLIFITARLSDRLPFLRVNYFAIIVCFVCLTAIPNFITPFMQWFPRDVIREVSKIHKQIEFQNTIDFPLNGIFDRLDQPPFSNYTNGSYLTLNSQIELLKKPLLLNVNYFYPIAPKTNTFNGKLIWQTPHPAQYKPYQYEGYTPYERFLLKSINISIQLLDKE